MRRFYPAITLLTILVLLTTTLLAAAQEVPGQTYIAREDETLLGISQRFEISEACIRAANDLDEDAALEVGQEIFIPDDCDAFLDAGGGAVEAESTPEPDALETTPDEAITLTEDTTYTVVAGDRLSRIAQNFGVTVACLVRANNIANPNLIFVGQELFISADCQGAGGGGAVGGVGGGQTGLDLTCQFDRYPHREAPGGLYTIRPGDTLDYIACDFGISLSCLLESNPQITNNKRVAVGSQITINTACPAWDGGYIP